MIQSKYILIVIGLRYKLKLLDIIKLLMYQYSQLILY